MSARANRRSYLGDKARGLMIHPAKRLLNGRDKGVKGQGWRRGVSRVRRMLRCRPDRCIGAPVEDD
jgi:hypothetical protein